MTHRASLQIMQAKLHQAKSVPGSVTTSSCSVNYFSEPESVTISKCDIHVYVVINCVVHLKCTKIIIFIHRSWISTTFSDWLLFIPGPVFYNQWEYWQTIKLVYTKIIYNIWNNTVYKYKECTEKKNITYNIFYWNISVHSWPAASDRKNRNGESITYTWTVAFLRNLIW